jgi:2-dehydro-3-deoxy-D-arabinonate dehydratase
MTHLVRYVDSADRPAIGIIGEDRAVRPLAVSSLADLLALPLADIRAAVGQAAGGVPIPGAEPRLLPPVDGLTEVWAGG